MQHGIVLRQIGEQRSVLPLTQAIDAAIEHQARSGGLAPKTFELYVERWKLFGRFAATKGAHSAVDVTPELIRAFLDAPFVASRLLPADNSKLVRRSSLRKLFSCLRAINAVSHDPLADIVLPGVQSCGARPLTDDEIETCRYYARRRRGHTRYPALWALVETGATIPEITKATAGDIDVGGGVALLSGGYGTKERIVPLSDWSAEQLSIHIERACLGPADHAVFGGPVPTVRLKAQRQNLDRILELAGLRDDPRATTYSVRGWLGRQLWNESGRIEVVATRLGLNSTDRAWEVIDVDWRTLG